MTDQPDTVQHARTTPDICELPHQTREEEDDCERRRIATVEQLAADAVRTRELQWTEFRAHMSELRQRAERAEAERDSFGREADRLRKDWTQMRTRAEQAEADRDDLRKRLKATSDAASEATETIYRVQTLANDMRTWCSPHGVVVSYSDRILEALAGPDRSPTPADKPQPMDPIHILGIGSADGDAQA